MNEQADVSRDSERHEATSDALSREQLYDSVWREPMLRVGDRLGVSSSYMARVCTELRVPRSPRGYWAQLEFGKAHERPALPAARPGDLTEWRPGDFIGTAERAMRASAKPGDSDGGSEPTTAEPIRPRRRNQAVVPEKSHPLIQGIRPLFDKTRDSENGILRPYKRLMADILASKGGLDGVLTAADRLYQALTLRGHRVAIAPSGMYMRRAEVDLREEARKNHYQRASWSAERPTVVYIGDIPIGLTLFEMTEAVEMMYVGNSKYVPVSSLTAEQRRRMTRPHYWTTHQDQPSGRLRLQAYCTSQRVAWSKQWSEAKAAQFPSLIPNIMQELEAAGPMLAEKVEAARIEAEEIHRQWEKENRQRREAEARARQQKRRQEALQDLLAVIDKAGKTSALALPILVFAATIVNLGVKLGRTRRSSTCRLRTPRRVHRVDEHDRRHRDARCGYLRIYGSALRRVTVLVVLALMCVLAMKLASGLEEVQRA